MRLRPIVLAASLIGMGLAGAPVAHAQMGPGGPPAVGTVQATLREVTEISEFVGRIQATDRVDLVARVTAFIQERLFTEGAEVNKGDLLYRLERGPFEADVQAKIRRRWRRPGRLLRNASHHPWPRQLAAQHAGRPAFHGG